MTFLEKSYCGLIVSFMICSCCLSCGIEKEDCTKYIHEIYSNDTISLNLSEELDASKIRLCEKFETKTIEGLDYPAYQSFFYSSHNYGQTIRFENRDSNNYTLEVKCISTDDWQTDCIDDHLRITKEDWDTLEEIIYEFNFWTEPQFEAREVLDGYGIILEGNRPDAKFCNKKEYQMIVRGSPRYDKIGDLYFNIQEFKDQLIFRYNQKMFLHQHKITE